MNHAEAYLLLIKIAQVKTERDMYKKENEYLRTLVTKKMEGIDNE